MSTDMKAVQNLVQSVAPDSRCEAFAIRCTERRLLASAAAVWSALAALGPCTGWWQSTGSYGEMVEAPGSVQDSGQPPVAAELLAGSVSWHLRQAEAGWSLWRFERVADAASLGCIERFLVEGKAGWVACYEVGWEARQDPWGVPALRPLAARFCGFEKAGGVS